MRAVNKNGALLMTGAGGGGGGGTTFTAGFSTMGNTAGNTGLATDRLVLVGSNNITLSGSTNAGSITVSIIGAGGGGMALSAAGNSVSAGTVVFSNSNNVSFGMAGSTVTGTATFAQTNQQITLFATGNTTQSSTNTSNVSSLIFAASGNGLSVGLSGGSILYSAANTIAQTNQQMTLLATGNTTQSSTGTTNASSIIFRGGGDVSVGITGGSIVMSVTQSNQAFSAAGGSSAFQTLSFSDNAQASFTNNAGQLGITNVRLSLSATGNTTQSSTGTMNASSIIVRGSNQVSVGISNGSIIVDATTAAQTNQQMTMFATGNTTLSSTGTSNASSLIFRGSGAASVGITNGSVLIDVAAGAAAITQSIGMSTQTAGGGTGGTTGYATGDDILYHFVAGSNITMSQSLNGASGTLTIYGTSGGGGGGFTAPGYNPYDDFVQVIGQVGQASLLLDPQVLPNVSFDRIQMYLQNTNSSNSSGSHTLSFWVGLYTRNASTLSLYTSFSGSTAVTHSGTAGSYSWYSGLRGFAFTFGATSVPENRYWLGYVSRTTSGGANGTYSNFLVSNINSQYTGLFGTASNATMQPKLGQGFYTATTSGMPNSIGFSQINGTVSNARRFPAIGFGSGTV